MTNESAPNGLQRKGIDLYKNPMTRKDVETIVERSLGSNYKIHNYYVKSYSNEHLGFMGAHRNFVIEASKEGSTLRERHTYFLKSVPYNVDDQAKFVNDSKMFFKETSFYNLIMPELMKSSKDKSWAPQCYLVKDDALVFENLVMKNYVLRDKYLDVTSLKSALTSLAKMHAASRLAEKRLGKSFLDMHPELMEEVLFNLDGPFAEWNRCGINVLIEVAKYLKLDHQVVSKLCNLVYELIKPSKTRKNVICHGDVWSNNLMFCGSKCALVDFQLMRYVPPMIDVAQLLYHNAKKELRDKYEKELLQHYHQVLCNVLNDGGLDVPEFDDILKEFDELRIFGIVMINLNFQINQLDADKQKEYISTSEGFNNLLFKDRSDLVLESMEMDARYRDIISSAIRELIDVAPKYLK